MYQQVAPADRASDVVRQHDFDKADDKSPSSRLPARRMRASTSSALLRVSAAGLIAFTVGACERPGPLSVSFSTSAAAIDAYDFIEVTARVSWPRAPSPTRSWSDRSKQRMDVSAGRWMGSAIPTTEACSACDSWRRALELTDIRSITDKVAFGERLPARSRPTMATAADRPGRSGKPLALRLGGHPRALLLQRHDGVLADRLAR